jgi:hypothetical protein
VRPKQSFPFSLSILKPQPRPHGPFHETVRSLRREPLTAQGIKTLQVNVGYRCNLSCTHCHVDAGPGRTEIMDGGTVDGKIDGGTDQAYLNGKVGRNVKLEARHVRFDSLYAAGEGTQLCLPKALDQQGSKFVPTDLTVTIKQYKPFYQRFSFYWLLLSFLVVGIFIDRILQKMLEDLA